MALRFSARGFQLMSARPLEDSEREFLRESARRGRRSIAFASAIGCVLPLTFLAALAVGANFTEVPTWLLISVPAVLAMIALLVRDSFGEGRDALRDERAREVQVFDRFESADASPGESSPPDPNLFSFPESCRSFAQLDTGRVIEINGETLDTNSMIRTDHEAMA